MGTVPDHGDSDLPVKTPDSGDVQQQEMESEIVQGEAQAIPDQVSMTSTSMLRAIQTSGPLPRPEWLGGYEKILPGAAERILAMAEKEESHRHEMDRERMAVVRSGTGRDQSLAFRGQIFAFILALVTITGGIALAFTGKSAIGVTSIVTASVALVSVFFYDKYHQRRLAERQPLGGERARGGDRRYQQWQIMLEMALWVYRLRAAEFNQVGKTTS